MIILIIDFVEEVNEQVLKKDNLIATLPWLEKEYAVSFKLKPISYSPGWKSVIHLTIGQDYGRYGDRSPAAWFLNDGSGRLTVASAVNGNHNYYFISEPLPLNKWSSIRISQYRLEGIYRFTVYLNGKIIHSVENTKPQSFKNVKVYTADPWYDTQAGSIKDLSIVNGNVGECSFCLLNIYNINVATSIKDISK